MKKYIIPILLIAISFSALTVNAQNTLKIGHINSQELLASMPESDSAQAQLLKIGQGHETMIEELSVEFNRKFEEYRVAMEAATLSSLAQSTKEGELQEAQTRIQNYEQQAQQDYKQKQIELMQPVHQKALDAVNAVAEENGFTYVFDISAGGLIYSAPDAEDIMPLVKVKLGIE